METPLNISIHIYTYLIFIYIIPPKNIVIWWFLQISINKNLLDQKSRPIFFYFLRHKKKTWGFSHFVWQGHGAFHPSHTAQTIRQWQTEATNLQFLGLWRPQKIASEFQLQKRILDTIFWKVQILEVYICWCKYKIRSMNMLLPTANTFTCIPGAA